MKEKQTKFERIKALLAQGLSPEEISRQTRCDKSYVYQIRNVLNAGFSSPYEHQVFLAKREGFKNVQRQRMATLGFERPIDLLSDGAKKEGIIILTCIIE